MLCIKANFSINDGLSKNQQKSFPEWIQTNCLFPRINRIKYVTNRRIRDQRQTGNKKTSIEPPWRHRCFHALYHVIVVCACAQCTQHVRPMLTVSVPYTICICEWMCGIRRVCVCCVHCYCGCALFLSSLFHSLRPFRMKSERWRYRFSKKPSTFRRRRLNDRAKKTLKRRTQT